jgi:glycosyltransferase involved in cell wall biosynthesis
VCGHVGPHEGDMAYLAQEHGVELEYIPGLGRELSPLRDVVTLFKLWRLMRRWQPDVVHTHTAKAGFVGRSAAWLARVPVRVHTFHGHVFHSYFGPLKTRLFLALERLTARLSDRLIAISPAQKDELATIYHIAPPGKIVVLPLCLDLAPFATVARHAGDFRREFGLPADAPLIGIVGRFVPVKNHELFLRMAAELRRQLPNARFALIGDGETRPAIEALAEALGLSEAAIFTGFLRDLRPAYSDMDVLVISSHNEGTPVSIIEALAAGVPVVSTAVGGVPDLLQNGALGRLVPPGQPVPLAEAVAAALHDAPAARDATRQAVLDTYDVARVTDELADLYQVLLSAKGRWPGP